MTKKLFIPSKYCSNKENDQIADYLDIARKNNNGSMQGMVCTIHETKSGIREILPPTHNHIVLCGRRWVMQACMNQNFSESIAQKDWSIKWFGVGSGGALAATPGLPLDTADTTTDLLSPTIIQPTLTDSIQSSDVYTTNGLKKNLYRVADNSNWVEMSYSDNRSEVMMLAQLQLTYDDCPYGEGELSSPINELGLYASPSDLSAETNFVLFSRYCRPTIYKSSGDSYLFLWYIYF